MNRLAVPVPARGGVRAKEPSELAYGLVDAAYNPADWDERLKEAAIRPLAAAIVSGCVRELALNAAALQVRGSEKDRKLTSAESIAARLNIPIPDGVSLDFPQWLKGKVSGELADIFAQPYWTKINQTTRDDVAHTVDRGLMEGLSIRQIAKGIEVRHGGTYTRARAANVARTETTGAMNSGHKLGIERLQGETGLEMGKEWLSVLGPTTRDSHAAADGQTVSVDEDFNIGGHQAPYPGHWSLPAGERVNCQCTIVSTFVGETTREELPEVEPVAEPVPEPTPTTPKPGDDAPKLPGSQDVSKEDLEATGAWISRKQEALDVLQKIGLTPSSFAEEMTAGLPYRVQWLEIIGNGDEVDLQFALWDGERQVAKLARTLIVEGDGRIVARHDYFELHSDLQGQDIAKTILANAEKLYDQLGVSAIKLVANIDVGGYAWARYGFSPTADAWTELKSQVLTRWNVLQRRASEAGYELPKELRRVVESALLSEDPKSVWLLSDLQGKLPESLGSVAGEKIAFNLLGGTEWDGALDMSDAEARRRLRSYVSR